MQLFGSKAEILKLQQRVDQLETSSRQMQLEWLSTYDKFRSILARIAKRQSRDAAVSDSAAGFQEADDTPSLAPTSASSLTERQRQINARILARRVHTEREQ